MLDPRLLELLVCPKCKGNLTIQEDPPALRCGGCRVTYPIRDGIPVLLIDQAVPFDEH